jgi:hypothetical protein
MNIYETQRAIRSFANMNGLAPGMDTSDLPTPIDVKAALLGEEGYLAREPECPGGGEYQFGGNRIPLPGELYMSCTLASADEHVPARHGS